MKRLNGFSLMETMVVLTIVAIVAAASAPMVNRKMVRASGDDSPWKYVSGGGSSIGYNYDREGRETKTASIGVLNAPAAANNSRLYIDIQNDGTPHIAFGRMNGNIFKLIAGGSSNNIWLSTDNIPAAVTNSIAIGSNASSSSGNCIAIGRGARIAEGTSANSIVIGSGASSSNRSTVVIGPDSRALGASGVAIGNHSEAIAPSSIAIGNSTYTAQSASNSIALGRVAVASEPNAVAIGYNSIAAAPNSIALGGTAKGTNSVAIGYGVTAGANTIAIGTKNHIVDIPGTLQISNLTITGNLVVEGNTLLGGNRGSATYVRGCGHPNKDYRICRFNESYSKVDRQNNRGSIVAMDMTRDFPKGVAINGKTYTEGGATTKNEEIIDNNDSTSTTTSAETQAKITELENKNAELEAQIKLLNKKIAFIVRKMNLSFSDLTEYNAIK